MPFNIENAILASDFVSFKAEVKAECLRRKYTGSCKGCTGNCGTNCFCSGAIGNG